MKKDFLIIAAIITLVVLLLNGTKFQTVEEYYMTHAEEIQPNSKTVTLSIEATTLIHTNAQIKPELRKYIPSDGVILKPKKFVLHKKDSVFTVLQKATRQHQIQMEYQGAGESVYKSAYIQGINYLYEFSAGANSGWMYRVNGKFPNVGVSRYKLKNGDRIEFLYTTDLGEDIGRELN